MTQKTYRSKEQEILPIAARLSEIVRARKPRGGLCGKLPQIQRGFGRIIAKVSGEFARPATIFNKAADLAFQ